ncbi:MAG: glycoside hydrolase family 3 N-terminal domain-containing protein [Verrucomicrobiota bacterium]|jgi:beta-glucosidase
MKYQRKFPACLTVCVVGLMSLVVGGAAAPGSRDCKRKAEALLGQMTLEEKIGQMTQVDMNALKDKADIQKYCLGSMLSGGDSDPADISAAGWLRACQEYQAWALKTRLKIPLLYGIDAVHGHNNVKGAVIFPHNIGLGATRNPRLVEQAEHITALELAGTGIHWAFAPCVAVARDIRWGRTYESFGESPELVAKLAAAAVKGFGRPLPNGGSVLACPKHFLGDGGTQDGVDQGNTVCDEATLRQVHLAPYVSAVKAGAGSIMVSYSSWNGQKMHGNKHLLTDVLKGELGFQGFVVSDWAAIDQLSPDYKTDIERAINAGLDMAMIPNGPGQKNNYVDFITLLKQSVAEGKVSPARIDDAVGRILRVKYEIGLFEHPYGAPELVGAVGSAEHRQVARECVRQSLVLLKNSRHALPLSKRMKQLAVVGPAADDLGTQCGGWTISWQGQAGQALPGGTTILQAIRRTVGPDTKVTFSPDGAGLAGAEAVLVVIGEPPYAEMKGDRAELGLAAADAALVARARETAAPVVTVLLSGRPLILGSALDSSDAFVAAWLPGTEGQGVADVLFGEAKPRGKLPHPWPRTNAQLAHAAAKASAPIPLFPNGFGLTY